MAYCKNCGAQISDSAAFCPNCGTAQNSVTGSGYSAPASGSSNYSYDYSQPYAPQQDAPVGNDSGGFWWGFLGCCLPVVGLILFLVWKDTKPKTAKSVGVGALVSVILVVVFYVLLFAIGMLGAIMG